MIFKYFAFANLFPNLRKAKKVPGSHCHRELFVNTIAYASAFHPSFIVPLKFIRRVAGKISNYTVGILQVKNNKNGIVAVLYWPFTIGLAMQASFTSILSSKTALPWRRSHA